MTEKMIWVTFQRAGIHSFPEAATNQKFADVSYLGYPHRHLFKFRISIEVYHNDREIEFHQFLNWIQSLYQDQTLVLDHKSCEMMSDELAEQITSRFPGRKLIIEVSEDGECGSISKY